jgi:hypothetical protein
MTTIPFIDSRADGIHFLALEPYSTSEILGNGIKRRYDSTFEALRFNEDYLHRDLMFLAYFCIRREEARDLPVYAFSFTSPTSHSHGQNSRLLTWAVGPP